jgi:hypothetical protein
MAKKLYWAICIVALILSLYFAPQHVSYEWGAGLYIAIIWGAFLILFGIVAFFSEDIKKYLEDKK